MFKKYGSSCVRVSGDEVVILSSLVVCSVVKGAEASGSNAPDRQMSLSIASVGVPAPVASAFVAASFVPCSVDAPVAPLSVGSNWLLCKAGTVSLPARFPKLLHGNSRCPLGAISNSKETVPGDNDLSKS